MSGTPTAAPGAPIRVFLLDDHEVVRRGLHDLLVQAAVIATEVWEKGQRER